MFTKPVGALQDLSLGRPESSPSPGEMAAYRSITLAMHISGRKPVVSARVWNTLEELRDVAMSRGCTSAQFSYAIEVMGTETHHVANYLQQHGFIKALSARTSQVA